MTAPAIAILLTRADHLETQLEQLAGKDHKGATRRARRRSLENAARMRRELASTSRQLQRAMEQAACRRHRSAS